MSRKTTPNEEQLILANGLHSLAIRMLRRLRYEDVRAGVGPARLSVLSILVFGGASTMSELAEAEQVKRPTMSRLVTGLERDGLARRSRDTPDRRAVRVKATGKGRRLLEKARRRRLVMLARRLEHLSASEEAVVREAERILGPLFD